MSGVNEPFPMRSKEAAILSASVEGEKDETDWNTMNTTTDGSTPSELEIKSTEAQEKSAETLISQKSPSARNRNNNGVNDDDDDDDDPYKDEFMDRPLNQGPPLLLEKIIMKLYGPSLPLSEFLRLAMLSMTLFFMIGGYWLLRSLKDPVLSAICGVTAIPKAKMLSVVVVLGVVTIYNKLLDTDTPRHKLFFLFGSFYFILFASIAFFLEHPTIGLPNKEPSLSRLLGWVSYCSIESFGSVMVSLFWSFTNSHIGLETAKAGYGFLVAMAQVGSIIGPTVVNTYAESWGVSKCYMIGALTMLLLQGSMWLYVKIYDVGAKKTSKDGKVIENKKEKAGVLEGLKLFWKYNYVKGVFAISCLFMVEVTIVDYTMKVLASEEFDVMYPCDDPSDSCYGTGGLSSEATNAFTTFMGRFGQATNTLSLLLSLFGTSAIIRIMGLRTTLLLFPSLCLIIIIWIRINPTLWTVFGAMMSLKACSYALNNPTKEILYQPTSSAAKYKTKSWIDIFGARGSKALGSVVTNAFSDSATTLVQNGSLVGIAVASFLIWNARFMGKKFEDYTKSGFIVGEEEERNNHERLDVAIAQNESRNTSCAIDDEDDEDDDNDDDFEDIDQTKVEQV